MPKKKVYSIWHLLDVLAEGVRKEPLGCGQAGELTLTRGDNLIMKNRTFLPTKDQGPYAQHFTFFVTYELAQ